MLTCEEVLKEFEKLLHTWRTKKGKAVLSEGGIEFILELLRKPSPDYVMTEVGERNFIISKRIIGHRTMYQQIASCRNRAQTERLVKILNRGEEE